MSTDNQKTSIKNEIQKRKTQELMRAVEEQQVARARGEPSMRAILGDTPQAPSKRQAPPDQRRTTGTLAAVSSPRPASGKTQQTARISQTMSLPGSGTRRFARRFSASVVGIVLLVLIVGIGAAEILSQVAHPAARPLPVVSAADVVAHLLHAGVPVIDSRKVTASSDDWTANQEFQIDVQGAHSSGTFIILSYPSQDTIVPDLFRVRDSKTFKRWKLTTGSNLILLTSPDSDPAIGAQVQFQVLHFLSDPSNVS